MLAGVVDSEYLLKCAHLFTAVSSEEHFERVERLSVLVITEAFVNLSTKTTQFRRLEEECLLVLLMNVDHDRSKTERDVAVRRDLLRLYLLPGLTRIRPARNRPVYVRVEKTACRFGLCCIFSSSGMILDPLFESTFEFSHSLYWQRTWLYPSSRRRDCIVVAREFPNDRFRKTGRDQKSSCQMGRCP